MSMMNTGDILETIEMFTQDNLDVRTVTMGISLLDCAADSVDEVCDNIWLVSWTSMIFSMVFPYD